MYPCMGKKNKYAYLKNVDGAIVTEKNYLKEQTKTSKNP